MSERLPIPLVHRSRTVIGASLLAAVVLLCAVWLYWPGITGPTLLDDRSSVLVIGDLKNHPERAFDYIFGDKSGYLGRSVSMTSFVLEKMYLDQGPVGGKKVNIFLHAVNGALVIWLFWLLFRYQQVPGYRLLSVLLGALWLLHPLLVSSVLYIVQRMAMLATGFMLLASISYVYWRQGVIAGKRSALRFLPVPVFFLLALFSKENAIVLVPVLLLLELWWFEFAGQGGSTLKWLRSLTLGLIGSGAAVLGAILLFRWDALAARFYKRPFTLEERLLTQSRAVWDYVGQWLHPQVARMGLYHDDYVISKSVFDPAITAWAIAGWLLLVLVCGVLLRWRSGRWIVFGIAWFVVGHSVESTVLTLELYFEHRNYYPTIGLALAVGGVFAAVVRRWPEPKAPLLAVLGVGALLLSLLTSSQVQIWSNRSLLNLAHLNAHPASPRANIDMATELAGVGEVAAAYRYSRAAYENNPQERSGDFEVRNLALSCIAGAPPAPGMIEQLGAQDPKRPLSSVTTLLTLVRLLQDNRCPHIDRIRFADRLAELYLVDDFKRKASPKIYSNLAVLENALQRYDNAYAYAEQFLALSPNNTRGLLMKLHFATALGKAEAASDVIATLQALDAEGKLTVGQQQTLAIYLEN